MIKRLLTIVIYLAITAAIVALFVSLIKSVNHDGEELTITSLRVEVKGEIDDRLRLSDGGNQGVSPTVERVHSILKQAKVEYDGVRANTLSMSYLEQLLVESGFIERAECYVNSQGEMTIEVWRREAALRILVDGYNSYLSYDGYLFTAPQRSPLLTHVVTGGYRPLFGAGYMGYVDDCVEQKIELIDREIEAIEREKYPILKRQKENSADRSSLRKRYITRRLWESEDEFDQRVFDLRSENQRLRTMYSDRQREIDADMARVKGRIDERREAQKKLRKKCEDIYNLLIFVEMVDSDPFWRSEVVQIMLDEDEEGDMRLSFALRSGDIKVVLGSFDAADKYKWDDVYLIGQHDGNLSMDGGVRGRSRGVKRVREQRAEVVEDVVERRLDRLREFYRVALSRVGWDRYKQINIEYENQVVCR